MHREGDDDFREGKMPFAKDFGIVFDDADPTANRVFNALMRYRQLQARIFYNTVLRSELFRSQNMYIKVIATHEGINQTELADYLALRRASVTNALQHLERDGFIRRTQDERDERVPRVWLTDKGREIVQQIDRDTVADINACFRLDEDEADSFIRSLDKINDRMKEHIARFERRADEANT